MLCRVERIRTLWVRYRTVLRNVVYLASLGLAVHLILPRIPGLEHSARLVVEASPLLVGAAFVAELLSEMSYAELLGRSVAAASRSGHGRTVQELPRSRHPFHAPPDGLRV